MMNYSKLEYMNSNIQADGQLENYSFNCKMSNEEIREILSETDEVYGDYKDYVKECNKDIEEMRLYLQIRKGINKEGKPYLTNLVDAEIKNTVGAWWLIHLDSDKFDINKLLEIGTNK